MPTLKQKAAAASSKGRTATAAVKALAPIASAPTGLTGAQLDFTAGSKGNEQKLVWSRYNVPWSLQGSSAYTFNQGGFVSRERNQAQAIATEFTTSNPLIATLLENLTTRNVGTGLTLSSKLDAAALNVTPKEARDLSSAIEKAWKRYAGSAIECDLSGRFDLHDLAGGAYESWLRTGEVLLVIDWKRISGANSRTKVSLLDPGQLDATKTMSGPGPGDSTFQGVSFDASGRAKGFWIRPLKTGHFNQAPVSVYVPARTSWGRQRVVHLFQLRTPGQVRGLSPLTAALTPAQEKSTLGEFTLDAALLQTQYALTIESDLPSTAAMNGLRTGDDGFSTGMPSGTAFDPIGSRVAWYSGSPVNAAPGVINHLAVGDKLKMNRAQTPNDTFQDFDKSLARLAATAAGSSVADATGDYSDVNFSASRMANETPHQINLRRRKIVTEALYRAVFAAWLEEAIEVGTIELPRGAPSFHAARDVYTEALFLGSGRIQPDPLKAAQATKLEIELGLTTLTDALAERGKDFETVLEERKAERDQLREAGLSVAVADANADKTIDPNDEELLAEQADSLPTKSRKRK